MRGEEATQARIVGGERRQPLVDQRPLPPGPARVAGRRELVAVEAGADVARRRIGEGVGGQEAERLGLVNRCVPLDEFEEATEAFAQRLAAGPTHAYALIKELMNQSLESDLETTLRFEGELQDIAINTADHREGVSAFLEKRHPHYQGN